MIAIIQTFILVHVLITGVRKIVCYNFYSNGYSQLSRLLCDQHQLSTWCSVRTTHLHHHRHHHQPINDPTAGAQAFLMDYT
jgi:hypothetical protein